MLLSENRPIRAAIIVPPIQDFYTTPHRMSSLGAKIVLQLLKQADYEVLLIDGMKHEGPGKQIPLPSSLLYLKPHLIPNETEKCSFFTRFRHFGCSYEEIVLTIGKFDPGICFISCFAFCYSAPVLELSKRIKQKFPDMVIVVGGAGVSVYPDFFLRNASVDYTLGGEAEICLPPFISFLQQKRANPHLVSHLGWKENGKCCFSAIVPITTADSIQPIIAETDGNDRRTVYTASLSRGCHSSCRFCSNHLTHGRPFRHCTIGRFGELLQKFPNFSDDHAVHFNFEDDNLLCDVPFFRSVMEHCRRRFPDVRFSAENGLDYRLTSAEQCHELIAAGFTQFNFTLGSVSSKTLDQANRSIDIDKYDELLSCAERYAIPVITYVICGFPEDTKTSIAENLRFLLSRKTIIGISLFYPVPGIPGFEDRTLFDEISPQRCTGSAAYSWSDSLSTGTLITAFRLARLINLMKSTGQSDEEKAVIERTISTGKLHTVVKERRQRRIVEVPKQDAELVEMVLDQYERTNAKRRYAGR